MSKEWYYAVDGKQSGPVSGAELKHAIKDGIISETDLVWKDGMKDWLPLNEVVDVSQLRTPKRAQLADPPPRQRPPQREVANDNPYNSDDADEPRPRRRRREFAGFWLRFVALFIDNILIGVIFWGGLIAVAIFDHAINGPEKVGTLVAIFYSLGLLGSFLYAPIMESSQYQATLGKIALGIEVCDTNGRRISFLHALARHMAKILSSLILLIGFLMAAFTECKQGLHDMICGTYVVRK